MIEGINLRIVGANNSTNRVNEMRSLVSVKGDALI